LDAALTRSGPNDPAFIARLRQRIADDPACTPGDLARFLGLSHDYATRRIRAVSGFPPRTFILRERLRLAADRLAAAELTWQQVCSDLGWRDEKLFLRQFRAAFGLPPGRWRSRLA
jgi:AraC family transcriptional regulator